MIFEIAGKGKKRDDFLKEYGRSIRSYLGEQNKELFLIIFEMIKNIFDHTVEQKGILIIEKTLHSITFFLEDQEDQAFVLKDCIGRKNGSTQQKGINFGFGLEDGIIAVADDIGLDLKIDTSRGFVYRGVMQKKER